MADYQHGSIVRAGKASKPGFMFTLLSSFVLHVPIFLEHSKLSLSLQLDVLGEEVKEGEQ